MFIKTRLIHREETTRSDEEDDSDVAESKES